MIIKSEGFIAEIILPANTCQAKVLKKLQKAMPVGTYVKLTATDKTLNKVISND